MAFLEVEQLTVTARTTTGSKTLVEGLSFSLEQREALAIVGESGSGKTMTAMALLGLLPHNCRAGGRVTLEGQELLSLTSRQRRRLLGKTLVLAPQSGSDCLNPMMTVKRQFFETLRRQGMRGHAAMAQEACRLLAQVELDFTAIASKYPFQLSGGMAQRLVMAMGMAGVSHQAGTPRLVVADEPTAGVDDETARGFMHSLADYFPQAAIVLITHNLAQAMVCHKQLLLRGGRQDEEGVEAWLRCSW